jgi:hypothetical protein
MLFNCILNYMPQNMHFNINTVKVSPKAEKGLNMHLYAK